MTGTDLKTGRVTAGWTQQKAASRLGLTQAYLSMVEHGRRRVTPRVAARAMKTFDLPPTALPLKPNESLSWSERELKTSLGALGYPGFAYLGEEPARNPAQLLFYALDQPDLDTRVVEALPWLASVYLDMDWEWLTRQAKLTDRQNRLGFVVALAGELASKAGDRERSQRLAERRDSLDRSRLAAVGTLCHDSMTQAERKWLRENRSAQARHWNLLTDLEVKHLTHAAA
ncbi:MAG: helix-turn-helix domain-containing protein [Terracidiphilus sp.]